MALHHPVKDPPGAVLIKVAIADFIQFFQVVELKKRAWPALVGTLLDAGQNLRCRDKIAE